MDLNQFFGRGRDSENYRDTTKIKPKADDDDPKTSSGESANMDDICSCIHERGDSEHYYDITKRKHDGTVEAEFSCDNRDPKPKSAYEEKLHELFHRKSRGQPRTELDLLTQAPTDTAFSGETSDQTFAPGGDSKHNWGFMKMLEAMFSYYNPAVQSAYMENISSSINQNDKSAVTTTAPLVAIPALAATSGTFDALPAHAVYVTITVLISVVLTGFLKGPVKNLWDCIVSKIGQFVRRSSGRDQRGVQQIIQISSGRDQRGVQQIIQISSGRDQVMISLGRRG